MKTFIIIFILLLAKPLLAVDLRATWIDNSNNEDGFRLESCPGDCTTSGLWSLLSKTGPNVTTIFPVSVIVNNITSFRVIAFNLVGDSASNVFVARAPNNPTLFSFTAGP